MDELFSSPEHAEFPISLHLAMLQDKVRMNIYENAIRSIVKPGDVVLDIGTGTGVLSFLAYKHGASKVIGYDRTSIVDYAKKIKQLNYPDAPIEFYQRDILSDDISEVKADVAICELFGNFGIDENVVSILTKVREKMLKPSGKILPETLELIVSPVQCTKSYRDIAFWKKPEKGIDFSPLQEMAYNTVYLITGESVRLLSEPKILTTIDFYKVKALSKKLTSEFNFSRKGTLHGIAGWFRSSLAPSNILNTGPSSHDTHWGQVLFPIGNPVNVENQGSMSFNFSEIADEANSSWNWYGKILPKPQAKTSIGYAYSASRRFYEN